MCFTCDSLCMYHVCVHALECQIVFTIRVLMCVRVCMNAMSVCLCVCVCVCVCV